MEGVIVNASTGYSLWPDACVSGDRFLGTCTLVEEHKARSDFLRFRRNGFTVTARKASFRPKDMRR